MNYKDLYTLAENVIEKPYIHRYWENKLNTEDNINWTSFYSSIYQCNAYHCNKSKLYTWKITDSPNCLACKCIEDYDHFFLSCRKIYSFWQSIRNARCFCGISENLRQMRYIFLGNKIPEYNHVNLLIYVISYSIYKSYFVRERGLKECNIFSSA